MPPADAPTLRLDCEAILGPSGAIAAARPDFEARPQQLRMAGAVAEAIEARAHLVVEAGTGVGKSYAYLIPAILHAIESRRRGDENPPKVIISTHTIALQEQLIEKDLPFLQEVLPPFAAALVKGRGNYVSKRRLRVALAGAKKLFEKDEQRDELERIAAWAAGTADGSKSDLDFDPSGLVWEEVQSDRHDCLKKKCPFYDECFRVKARARMKKADVLVLNHALYLTLLTVGGLLPDHDVVVFDEAHAIEGVATEHFGLTASNYRVLHALRKIWNERRGVGVAGRALPYFTTKWFQNLCKRVDRVWTASNEFFGIVQGDLEGSVRDDRDGDNSLRKKGFLTPPGWSDRLVEECKSFSRSLLEDAQRLEQPGGPGDEDYDAEKAGVAAALESAGAALAAVAHDIEAWLRQTEGNTIYFAERTERTIAVRTAPLNVGVELRHRLFEASGGPTCVLTSATLAMDRPPSFDYVRSRIGLSACETLRLGSPFDYRGRVTIRTVRGIPEPGDPRHKGEYERLVLREIPRYLDLTAGSAFVLFTSHRMLRSAAKELRDGIAARGWTLLVQRENLPRNKMITRFRKGGCVLLGTDSFWEGVDIPGDALRNVIITKLPFPCTHGDPIHEARKEEVGKQGKHPFMDYDVPIAVLKLLQGFGRLIRSRSDSGIVVILDPRIHTKGYGRRFLAPLPECTHVVDRIDAGVRS